MNSIKKIEVNSMYGKINRQRPTDLEQAETAVDMILRTPLQHRDFIIGIRALQNILDKAQNGPPQGAADESIDEKTWNMLSRFLKACLVINEEGYNITSTRNCRTVERALDRINPNVDREFGNPLDGLAAPNATICSVCHEPQFQTPSGPSCKNGHGGA